MSVSKFGKNGVRCDWCGRFSNNHDGAYERPVKNDKGYRLIGYIVQPEWERFPGGRTDVPNVDSSNDICEECAAQHDPQTGEWMWREEGK